MQRPEIADKIRGDRNPAKRPEVRAKISQNNAMKHPGTAAKVTGGSNGRARSVTAFPPCGSPRKYESVADCIREAATEFGTILDHGNISKVLRGERPHTKQWVFT